jgi:exopolysaccharide production protein ExoQ
MPPPIAALLCALFVFYLFWVDLRHGEGPSAAAWVPWIWLFLSSSRYVSQWLGLAALPVTPDVYLEGSPIDAAVFLILILCGIWILIKRRVDWTDVFTNNYWIWLFFLFGLFSIAWSDYPLVSLKRLFKASGNVVMALVILTERRPFEAFAAILKRISFVLIPLSVLFIKYFPEHGRTYGWGGRMMYTGAAFQKNGLGQICLLCCIYFSWSLLFNRDEEGRVKETLHWSVSLLLIAMTLWLITVADSATSLVCIVVAAGIFFLCRLPALTQRPRWIVAGGMLAAAVLMLLELALDASSEIIQLVGRDPTLTTRVPMWQGLLRMAVDPIVGAGYESFWTGDRLWALLSVYGVRQAHNGYLEMYLNLGLVGLALMIGWIVAGLMKVHRHMEVDYPSAVLRLCLIVVAVLYNWTEATIYGVSCMWVLLLLGVMDPVGQQAPEQAEPAEEGIQ